MAEAQSVVARECGFESWLHLRRFIDTPTELSKLERSIISTEVESTRQILRRSPKLVHALLYCHHEQGTTVLGLSIMARRADEDYRANMFIKREQIALAEAIIDAEPGIDEPTGYGGGHLAPLAIAAWLQTTTTQSSWNA